MSREFLMARWGVMGWLAVAATLVLASCHGVTQAEFEPIRYRLTATVETSEGVRTGSSVIEVNWAMSRTKPPLGGSGYTVKGEAAAVDLPGGQTLFVLLRSAEEVDWAAWVIKRLPTAGMIEQAKPTPSDRAEQITSEKRYLDLVRADRAVHAVWRPEPPHNLPGLSVPTLVRFRDIADPKSAELANPDDLAKSYGPGVELKNLTVQVTDEPVTTGIGKRLGWLANMENHSFDRDGPFDAKYPVLLLGLRKQ